MKFDERIERIQKPYNQNGDESCHMFSKIELTTLIYV